MLAACTGASEDQATNSTLATGSSLTTGSDGSTTSGATSPGEAFGPGDFMLPDPLIGLTTLSGYRASLTVSFEGTNEGEPQQWASTSELLRSADPAAAQLTVENTGDLPPADPTYVAELGGTTYRRDQAGTCTAEAADPEMSLINLLEPAGGLAGVIGAEPLGQKTIGGIDAAGYSFDERAVGQAEIARTSGEVWVAADGGYVLEYTMTSEGADDLFGDGAEGTITWQYELTEVNLPVVIEVPGDCPAGLVAAPMLPDASNVVNAPGLLSYHTGAAVADVLAFYQEASSDLGWAGSGEAAVGGHGGSGRLQRRRRPDLDHRQGRGLRFDGQPRDWRRTQCRRRDGW